MAHGMLLSLRLFLEGIEVDIVSVQVSGGLNQSAQAQIEIPYAVAASNILPRTLVHVFFLHTHYEADNQVAGTHVASVDENDPKQWKLLFAGEVVQSSYSIAGGSRSNYLTCQDFSSYWQAAQLYWGTGSNSYNSYKKVIMMGATQVTTGKARVQNGGALADLLSARPTSLPTLTGVLGGIVSLLEASSGVYGSTKYHGVNDFMSQAEVRLHLSRLIGAHAGDDTSNVYLRYGDLRSYFRRLTAAVQGTASFMDLVSTFLSKIHHVWASVPAPPYLAAGSAATVSQVVALKNINKSSDKELALWTERITNTVKVLSSRVDEMVEVDATSIEKTGQLPKDAFNSQKHEDMITKLKEAALLDGHSTAPGTPAVGVDRGNQTLLNDLSVRVAKDAVAKSRARYAVNTTEALGLASSAIDDLRQIATKDATGKYTDQTQEKILIAQRKLDAALAGIRKGTGAPTKVITKTTTLDSRLNMFLFMPDLYMVPPPKCNVLFPDHYMSLTFTRGWLSEPTRLWMFGQTIAGSETSVGYFSPNTSILSGPKAADSASAAQAGTSFMMSHEIYSGPVPVIKALGDMAVFKSIHDKQIATAKSGFGKVGDPKDSAVAGQARFSPQEHLQRAANYLFLAQRFEGRTMQVNAKFSPHIVPGLPMLVLDPPQGASSLQTGVELLPEQRGLHYVGLVASVQHALSTSGAGTTITLVKCRYHNEGLELFSKDGNVVDANTGILEYKKRIVRYSAPNNKKKGNLYGTGQISAIKTKRDMLDFVSNAQSLGDGYTEEISYGTADNGTETRTTKYKNIKTKEVTTITVKDLFIPDGAAGVAEGVNPDLEMTLKDDPSVSAGFNSSLPPSFEVVTAAPSRKSVTNKDLRFTFEATATPPWFASIYLPSKIGKEYYQVILGCGSVVDEALFEASKANNSGPTTLVNLPTANGTRAVEVPYEFTYPAVSTHDAAEQLADVWKGLKETGANIPLFLDTYTARSYATMLDIMGSANPWLRSKTPNSAGTQVEGFHGNAYGYLSGMQDYDGNRLDSEPTVPRLSPKDQKPATVRQISPDADPRKERYTRIATYVSEIARVRSSYGGK